MLLNPDRVTMNYTMADVVGLLFQATLLIPAVILPAASDAAAADSLHSSAALAP